MENHIWKTKKEKIVDYVRQDPFLKIEEIAENANTTPRYVRTILSEANISLMKLRKEYAMDIEKRSNRRTGRLLFSYILDVPFENTNINLEDKIIFNNPEDFNILKGDIAKNYINQSYKHIINTNIWCLNTFTLEKKYLDNLDESKLKKNLDLPEEFNNILINLIEEKCLTTSEIKVGVEAVNKQVGDLLGLETLSPVFKVKQKILEGNSPVMLNMAYFHPGKINLSISSNRGITIRRKVI